jgi:hypothetical protein
MVIVCQKPAQARAPGGGGAPRDSCMPDSAFSALLASIGLGILGDFPRYWRASSRAAAAINAPVVAIRCPRFAIQYRPAAIRDPVTGH